MRWVSLCIDRVLIDWFVFFSIHIYQALVTYLLLLYTVDTIYVLYFRNPIRFPPFRGDLSASLTCTGQPFAYLGLFYSCYDYSNFKVLPLRQTDRQTDVHSSIDSTE